MIRFAIVALLPAGALALLQGCSDDCASLRADAGALREEAQACGAGDSCVTVDMYAVAGQNNCLLAFQCTHALNAATDLDAFTNRARAIVRGYDGCSQCVIADCIDPSALVARCDEDAGRCALEPAAP